MMAWRTFQAITLNISSAQHFRTRPQIDQYASIPIVFQSHPRSMRVRSCDSRNANARKWRERDRETFYTLPEQTKRNLKKKKKKQTHTNLIPACALVASKSIDRRRPPDYTLGARLSSREGGTREGEFATRALYRQAHHTYTTYTYIYIYACTYDKYAVRGENTHPFH